MSRVPVVALVAMLVIAGACGSRDYDQLYVRNTSNETWLIRVPVGGEYPDNFFVTQVNPGADGVATRVWRGLPDDAIELLTRDCQIVGTLLRRDNKYEVPGVDGLDVTLLTSGINLTRRNTPEIIPLRQCGGVIF
jgi:hypothetical protein